MLIGKVLYLKIGSGFLLEMLLKDRKTNFIIKPIHFSLSSECEKKNVYKYFDMKIGA